MMMIIIGLIIALLVIVVVVNAIQQHKEKIEKERRSRAARQKAIINETEELILNLANIPSSPALSEILNKRSLNAIKAMKEIMPETKNINSRIQEYESRYNASKELAANKQPQEDSFTLPENDQHLVQILQVIKKVRVALKSEQSKGALDAQTFVFEDKRLDAVQLKINVESLVKRGNQAYANSMIGSARQYLEKALQSIADNNTPSEYKDKKHQEIEDKLEEITNELKNTNAEDRAKKAKSEEDDLDLLFQPKKKW